MMHLPASIQSTLQRAFGLPTLCMREFTKMGVTRPALLLRPFTTHILSQLLPQPSTASAEGSSDENGTAGASKRFYLNGPSGSGKSVSLLQIASVLMQADMPVLYVPNATTWTDGYYAYYPTAPADGQEAVYEQPELASEILSSLPPTAGLPSTPSSSPIDTLEALLRTRTHTLVVDQVNALDRPTLYRDKDGSPLPIHRMRVLQLLREAIRSHPSVVVAASYSSPRLRRSQGASFDGRKVDVPLLTKEETASLLDYYARHLGILHPPHDVHSSEGEQYVERKRFLSGSIPLELWRVCQLEHIYRPRAAA